MKSTLPPACPTYILKVSKHTKEQQRNIHTVCTNMLGMFNGYRPLLRSQNSFQEFSHEIKENCSTFISAIPSNCWFSITTVYIG